MAENARKVGLWPGGEPNEFHEFPRHPLVAPLSGTDADLVRARLMLAKNAWHLYSLT